MNRVIRDVPGPRGKRLMRFEMDADSPFQQHMLNVIDEGKLYEPESNFIVDHLRPGDLFLDCGAHIGWYSVLAGSLGAEVHAFEPRDSHYEQILRNQKLNGLSNLHAHHAAVGKEEGTAKLYHCNDNDACNSLWDAGLHPRHVKTRTEPCIIQDTKVVRLSPFVAPPPRRTWIKIDTEGCEAHIIEELLPTLHKLFEADCMPFFIIEINGFCLSQMGKTEDYLRGMLYKLGYYSYAHSEGKIIHIGPPDHVIDIVCNFVFWPWRLEVATAVKSVVE